MPRPVVTFEDAEVVKETDLALCVVIDGKERWFPKSVIDDDSEVYEEGDVGTLIVHEWFCEKEGLI